MKTLWKLSKEAIRYKALYALAIAATLSLTLVNLGLPGSEKESRQWPEHKEPYNG